MINRGAIVLASMLMFAGTAQSEDKEPSAVVAIGAAGEWALQGGGSSFGPAASVEVSAVKEWLEIEAGVSPLLGGGPTQWGTDLLFKKPFALSDSVELEFGVGPEWIHTSDGGQPIDSIAGEVVIELMLWPWPERKFGWYLEPSYGYNFGRGHEQSLGVRAGLLIAIR
ncbi:MAG: hypothetical protein P4L80_09500 [Xanthobacteraceae bacterium]|nr:hypothetical protein [Xanthobacteraceae bacterium]